MEPRPPLPASDRRDHAPAAGRDSRQSGPPQRDLFPALSHYAGLFQDPVGRSQNTSGTRSCGPGDRGEGIQTRMRMKEYFKRQDNDKDDDSIVTVWTSAD